MNDKEKLKYIKKHINGLKYLNKILTDALSYHQETGSLNGEFLYINKIFVYNKFFFKIILYFFFFFFYICMPK